MPFSTLHEKFEQNNFNHTKIHFSQLTPTDQNKPMYKIYLIHSFILLLAYGVNSQSEISTTYKDLEIMQSHQFFIEQRVEDNETTYALDGKKTSARKYKKYKREFDNLDNCRPCIIQYLDSNDNITTEGIFYGDAIVGWIKEYYPNGKLKLQRQYTENTSGNWDAFFANGNLPKENGTWKYYDENGAFHHNEYWENGEFIKQDPEQTTFEIWCIETKLNNTDISDETISIQDLKNIIIVPRYKNSFRDNQAIIAEFQFNPVGHKTIHFTLPIDNVHLFNFDSLFNVNGIDSVGNIFTAIAFTHNNEPIQRTYFRTIGTISNSTHIINDIPEDTMYDPEDSLITRSTFEYYLVNWNNPSKKFKIDNSSLYITYTDKRIPAGSERTDTELSGYLIRVNPNDIQFSIDQENTVTTSIETSAPVVTEYYYAYDYLNEGPVRTIQKTDLLTIKCTSRAKRTVRATSGTLITLSLLTTLLVAPLSSINYKSGAFNNTRFRTLAGIGLAGITVGIPLSILSRAKTYPLASAPDYCEYWYIQPVSIE